MYALLKRKTEWELRNEILLEQIKVGVVRGVGLLLYLLWKVGTTLMQVLIALVLRPKLVREVGPGHAPEETAERRYIRLFEQGPQVR